MTEENALQIKYRKMETDLKALALEYDTDAALSIWLGSWAAYNDGFLIGTWLSLPCDEDELQKLLDIVSENGAHDWGIFDKEGSLRDLVEESSDVLKLNEMLQEIGEEKWGDAECEALRWLMRDVGYPDFEDAFEKIRDRELTIYHGDLNAYVQECLKEDLEYHLHSKPGAYAYEERGRNSFINRLFCYIDWEYVCNEWRTGNTLHECTIDGDDYVFLLND